MSLQCQHLLWIESKSTIFVDLGKLLFGGVGSDLHVFDVCVGRGIGINERRHDRFVDTPALDDGVGKQLRDELLELCLAELTRKSKSFAAGNTCDGQRHARGKTRQLGSC